MDAHYKTNVEFHNDVNEVFTQHEANFNQINDAL